LAFRSCLAHDDPCPLSNPLPALLRARARAQQALWERSLHAVKVRPQPGCERTWSIEWIEQTARGGWRIATAVLRKRPCITERLCGPSSSTGQSPICSACHLGSSEQYCSQWNFNTDGFIGLVAVSTAPNPGRDVCCGRRQSMPSSKYPSCAGVIVTVRSAPSRGAVDGQTKRPRSNRFANKHMP